MNTQQTERPDIIFPEDESPKGMVSIGTAIIVVVLLEMGFTLFACAPVHAQQQPSFPTHSTHSTHSAQHQPRRQHTDEWIEDDTIRQFGLSTDPVTLCALSQASCSKAILAHEETIHDRDEPLIEPNDTADLDGE